MISKWVILVGLILLLFFGLPLPFSLFWGEFKDNLNKNPEKKTVNLQI